MDGRGAGRQKGCVRTAAAAAAHNGCGRGVRVNVDAKQAPPLRRGRAGGEGSTKHHARPPSIRWSREQSNIHQSLGAALRDFLRSPVALSLPAWAGPRAASGARRKPARPTSSSSQLSSLPDSNRRPHAKYTVERHCITSIRGIGDGQSTHVARISVLSVWATTLSPHQWPPHMMTVMTPLRPCWLTAACRRSPRHPTCGAHRRPKGPCEDRRAMMMSTAHTVASLQPCGNGEAREHCREVTECAKDGGVVGNGLER